MNIIGEKLIKRHIKAKKIKVTYFLRNQIFMQTNTKSASGGNFFFDF
jgi:hypothetical protein